MTIKHPVAFISYSEDADDEYGAGWQMRARTSDGKMHGEDHPTKAQAREAAKALGITDIVEFD